MDIPHMLKVVWPPPPLPKEPQAVTVECSKCQTKQILMVRMIALGAPVSSTGKAQTVECIECKENFFPFLPGPITGGPIRVDADAAAGGWDFPAAR
jgi:hypothetical protein